MMSDDRSTRTERDSLGEVEVPRDALFGAQTQRAVDNFPVGGGPLPNAFIRAMALIKKAAAVANRDLGLLDEARAAAIVEAASTLVAGGHADAFPVDVYQTGSGTSTNMNLNEVIANLATAAAGIDVHPNDHVNRGQSSNDVVPTAIAVSAAVAVAEELLPALGGLKDVIDRRADELSDVVKTGRTHLMDAMPVRFDQELGAWSSQVTAAIDRIESARPRLHALAIGGTAVGSGINTDPAFAARVVEWLRRETGIAFTESVDHFRDLACQDSAVELSGHLNTLAVSLTKIANDLRWMNSGPLAGLAEIELPALQPGSSIMPGKVNPVIAESVAMACARVMGNHVTLTVAGQSGSFQLNVMLPLVADTLLGSIRLMTGAARILSDKAIAGFTVNRERVDSQLARNPVLVTALNARIGYERGAVIAKRAWAEGRPVIDVAAEVTGIPREELEQILDPARLTRGGNVE